MEVTAKEFTDFCQCLKILSESTKCHDGAKNFKRVQTQCSLKSMHVLVNINEYYKMFI